MINICALEFVTKDGNRYIYDGVTGNVFPIDNIMHDCIIEMSNGKSNDEIIENLGEKYQEEILVEGAVNYISDYVKKQGGLFVHNNSYRIHKNNNFNTQDIENCLNNLSGTFQLILNITEDCNLRCKYCYLSDQYHYTRNRTCNTMDFEVAKKSMNQFFDKMSYISKYNPGKICAITFYGGEPLMNFQLVKKCIEYAREKSPISIVFTLTTNGVLLNKDISKYLVENEVRIAVSMDGTCKNHDRNRVFQNEKGSFDIVYQNLKSFKKLFPLYDNISILMVYDYKTDLEDNENLFESDDLPRVSFITMVASWNTDYYEQFTKEDYLKYQEQYNRLLDKYIYYKQNNKKITSFSLALFEYPMSNIIVRPRKNDKKLKILLYTGACMPGSKISVRTTGEYDMCERVNNTMCIGSSEDGIDYGKIVYWVKKYNNEITRDCYKCPINKNCPICYAQCGKDGYFEKLDCNMLIQLYIENLSIVYSVLEKNPQAYNEYDLPIESILNN